MVEELSRLLDQAKSWWQNASPEQRAAMKNAQRASFVRAMTTPCEHGELDFEQCGECRGGDRG